MRAIEVYCQLPFLGFGQLKGPDNLGFKLICYEAIFTFNSPGAIDGLFLAMRKWPKRMRIYNFCDNAEKEWFKWRVLQKVTLNNPE